MESFFLELVDGTGRSETRQALADYMTGLLLDGDRKSIQPIAARLVSDESETEAMRQRLQQCVVVAKWDSDVFRAKLQKAIFKKFKDPEAIIIDDTGFPKKGKHSPGVQRQYSGTLGRVDNCQIAVSTHLANSFSSERFPPLNSFLSEVSLPYVRRRLQQVILYWIGYCPLCNRTFEEGEYPNAASRM